MGDRLAIHVYEQQHVGGRLKSTVEIEGLTHELGGSMVCLRQLDYPWHDVWRTIADGSTALRQSHHFPRGPATLPLHLCCCAVQSS